MRGFWQDVQYGLRMLVKHPAFTLVAVFTLAVGIGANTAIYSVVDQVIMNPFGYRDTSALVKIWEKRPFGDRPPVQVRASIPNYLDYKAQNTVFEDVGAYLGQETRILHGREEPERVTVFVTAASMFPVLGVEPFLGRTFSADAQQPGQENVAVLGYGLWQRYFGKDAGVLGETIRLDDRFYTVVGVMPRGYWQGSDLWVPLVLAGEAVSESSRARPALSLWARMKPGITMEQATAEVETIAGRLAAQYPATNEGLGIALWSRAEERRERYGPLIWTLAGAVGFVLLVACANVAHLFLVRAAARQREVAVRTVHGASRWRIMRQLLIEGVLLSILGGALGILVALWGIRTMAASGDHQLLPRLDTIDLNENVLAFALGVSLLTGVLFSIIPALRSSRTNLTETLKDSGSRTTAGLTGQRFRQALFVSEVALTVVLLVGAGMMVRNFWKVLHAPMGFNPSNLLAVQIELLRSRYSEPAGLRAYYHELLPRLNAIPGVRTAALGSNLPLIESWNGRGFFLEGEEPAEGVRPKFARYLTVSPEYFLTLGIAVKLGRAFSERDREGTTRVVIVNESLVKRYLPEPNPLGRHLLLPVRGPDGKYVPALHQIVGVVGDHVLSAPEADAGVPDVIYAPYLQDPLRSVSLAIRSEGAPQALAGAVRREVLALGEDQAIYNMRSMDEQARFALRQKRFTMTLIVIFAGIALVLAAVGMYGMVSYTVAQRTHEFGIRLAIGAQRVDVVRGVVRQGAVLVAAGLVLGTAGSFALARVLESVVTAEGNRGSWPLQRFLGISTIDAGTCVVVALGMMVVALAACYVPARRATKVDPMTALRYE